MSRSPSNSTYTLDRIGIEGVEDDLPTSLLLAQNKNFAIVVSLPFSMTAAPT
jgi:hypothetical protein